MARISNSGQVRNLYPSRMALAALNIHSNVSIIVNNSQVSSLDGAPSYPHDIHIDMNRFPDDETDEAQSTLMNRGEYGSLVQPTWVTPVNNITNESAFANTMPNQNAFQVQYGAPGRPLPAQSPQIHVGHSGEDLSQDVPRECNNKRQKTHKDRQGTDETITQQATHMKRVEEAERIVSYAKMVFRSKEFSRTTQSEAEMLISQIEDVLLREKIFGIPPSNASDGFENSQSTAPSSSHRSVLDADLVPSGYQTDDTSALSTSGIQRPVARSPTSQECDGKSTETTCDKAEEAPLYYCTYPQCEKAIPSPTDWKRHEQTRKHWPQTNYMCVECTANDLPPEIDKDGYSKCQYCHSAMRGLLPAVVNAHYLNCSSAQVSGRVYGRKNRLVDHLRKDHGLCDELENIRATAGEFNIENKDWPRECGYCGFQFQIWSERIDHILKHYQNEHRHISQWRIPFFTRSDRRSQLQPHLPSRDGDDSDDSEDDDAPSPGHDLHRQHTAFRISSAPQSTQRSMSGATRRQGPSPAYQNQLCFAACPEYAHFDAYNMSSLTLQRYIKDNVEPLGPLLQAAMPSLVKRGLSRRSTQNSASFSPEQMPRSDLQLVERGARAPVEFKAKMDISKSDYLQQLGLTPVLVGVGVYSSSRPSADYFSIDCIFFSISNDPLRSLHLETPQDYAHYSCHHDNPADDDALQYALQNYKSSHSYHAQRPVSAMIVSKGPSSKSPPNYESLEILENSKLKYIDLLQTRETSDGRYMSLCCTPSATSSTTCVSMAGNIQTPLNRPSIQLKNVTVIPKKWRLSIPNVEVVKKLVLGSSPNAATLITISSAIAMYSAQTALAVAKLTRDKNLTRAVVDAYSK